MAAAPVRRTSLARIVRSPVILNLLLPVLVTFVLLNVSVGFFSASKKSEL